MYLERKEDLSIYYWLKDLFSDAPYITIRDGFPVADLTIPTISVEADTISLKPGELGNSSNIFFRVWYIDVFAQNKSARDEYAYRILHGLEESIPIYNYDEGEPPTVTPSRIGCLLPEDIGMKFIRVLPDLLVEGLYYRASISFTAVNNQF